MNFYRSRAHIVGWVSAALMVLLFISTISVGVRAADEQTTSDARCIVTSVYLLSTGKPSQRLAGMMAAMYYFGRLDGKASKAEIEKLITKEAKEMDSADVRASAEQCGQVLVAKGKEITQIGREISGR